MNCRIPGRLGPLLTDLPNPVQSALRLSDNIVQAGLALSKTLLLMGVIPLSYVGYWFIDPLLLRANSAQCLLPGGSSR
jgi:hypothetical protein